LPFLRFARDKRGYETTALVHGFRGRYGRTRQKLLYWFRTPPSVKVGRPALDEEAIRWIEEHNPDIDFDWQKILASTPPPSPPAEDANGRRAWRGKADRRSSGGQRPAQPRQAPPPMPAANSGTSVADPNLPESPDRAIVEGEGEAPEEAPEEALEEASEEDAREELEPEEQTREEQAPEEQALEQLTHPDAEELPAGARSPVDTIVPREQVIRLRARFAELQARITERGGEAARIEALRAQAEPLNPDSWVTVDEAKKGLEEFEARIRNLRAALGLRPRRRSRRGGRRHRGRPAELAGHAVPDGSASNTPGASNPPVTLDEPSKSHEPR
jgi:hypothetical protein